MLYIHLTALSPKTLGIITVAKLHFTLEHFMGYTSRKRVLAGIALLIFAIYLGWLALSYDNLPAELFAAPRWLLYILSFTLGAGAGLAFLGQDHPLSHLVAAVIWILFALAGIWAAVYSPLERLLGGISVLSPAANRTLARIIFGLGAILNLGVGFFAGWKFFKKE
jgi:hypothetical protein